MNRKGSHIKYHVVLNGKDHYYQRNYPTTLYGYCQAKGISKNHRQSLELSPDASLAEITAAVTKANEAFESLLKSITAANQSKLTEAERLKAASAFLYTHHLKPGMLYKDTSTSELDRQMLEQTKTVLLTTDFEEMVDYGKAEHWFLDQATDPLDVQNRLEDLQKSEQNTPEAILVQKAAWKLLHESPKALPTTLLFSDAWEAYWPTVAYNGKEKRRIRAADKTKRDWEAFISNVGNQTFTELNANKALARFLKVEMNRPRKDGKSGQLSSNSVRRRLVAPKAALNYLNDLEGLGYHIKAPKIRNTGAYKETYVMTQDEQKELLVNISNEEAKGYAQWKELFILIAMQTGAYASELQRAEHKLLVLDTDPAYRSLI